jgi:hypothetical protein
MAANRVCLPKIPPGLGRLIFCARQPGCVESRSDRVFGRDKPGNPKIPRNQLGPSFRGARALSDTPFQNSACPIPWPAWMLARALERSARNRGDRDSKSRSRSSSSEGASRTATARPLRVITTGPELPASSRNALSFALTSAKLTILKVRTPPRR